MYIQSMGFSDRKLRNKEQSLDLQGNLRRNYFFFFAWRGPSHCGDKYYSNTWSRKWILKNTTSHVLFQISLYRSSCNSTEIAFFVSFSLWCRSEKYKPWICWVFLKKTWRKFPNVVPPSWRRLSGMMFPLFLLLLSKGAWVFFYGSDTSPIFITPEKVLDSQRDKGRSWVHEGS